MLDLLLDGRAHSAGELASEARVAPSTASSHLTNLVDGALVTAERVGRHQLYRIADPHVARAMEALAILAPARQGRSLRQATSDSHLRWGRTCYDHLAGQLGVALTDALVVSAHPPPAGRGVRNHALWRGPPRGSRGRHRKRSQAASWIRPRMHRLERAEATSSRRTRSGALRPSAQPGMDSPTSCRPRGDRNRRGQKTSPTGSRS
jgi:hypothetical protein